MNIVHKRNIREYELNRVTPLFQQGSTILEIGAGAGWQAKALANKGYSVEAIDLGGGYGADVLPGGFNLGF